MLLAEVLIYQVHLAHKSAHLRVRVVPSIGRYCLLEDEPDEPREDTLKFGQHCNFPFIHSGTGHLPGEKFLIKLG